MGSRHFSQEQKMAILNSAAEIGVRQAAELSGVHYTSVYDWRRQLDSLGKQGFLDYKLSYPLY
jgi:transposase-like protein